MDTSGRRVGTLVAASQPPRPCPPVTDSSSDRDPLERLAEEFVARFRKGESPSVNEYAERHPDLADQIRELFPARVEMEQIKPATEEHIGAFAPATEPTDPGRAGEFRILRRVGSGGMGVVFRGRTDHPQPQGRAEGTRPGASSGHEPLEGPRGLLLM